MRTLCEAAGSVEASMLLDLVKQQGIKTHILRKSLKDTFSR